MQFNIRLSVRSEPDLLALLESMGNREFKTMIRDALRSAVRTYYVPKVKKPERIPELKEKRDRNISIFISDEDVIQLLEYCKPKKKSAFIKTAVRFYLGRKCILASMLDLKQNKGQSIEAQNEDRHSSPGYKATKPVAKKKEYPVQEVKTEQRREQKHDISVIDMLANIIGS